MRVPVGAQEWLEFGFNAFYLLWIYRIVLEMYTVKTTDVHSHGKPQRAAIREKLGRDLLRACFTLLIIGDSGHVGFRTGAMLLPGGLEENKVLVGAGGLATAITITLFYALVLEAWIILSRSHRSWWYILLQLVAFTRMILLSYAENAWTEFIPPFRWSVIRNIPLIIQGIGLIALILVETGNSSETVPHKHFFRKLVFLIALSFLFYTPVIFYVQVFPILGMLMIPKTLSYMAMAYLVREEFFVNVS